MSDELFWTELQFATDSPNLHRTLVEFRRFVSQTPAWEMEGPLVGYFGCTPEQVTAWIAFAHANVLEPERAKMLWAEAVAVTFGDGPWPGLFEMHRHDRSDDGEEV